MGNRALVCFKDSEGLNSVAVYLQWNGGMESIAAFMGELERRNYLRMDAMPLRFAQVVGEFFRGTGESLTSELTMGGLSIYTANAPKSLDAENLKAACPGDNGVYLIESSEPDYNHGVSKAKLSATQYYDGKQIAKFKSTLTALQFKKLGTKYRADCQDYPKKKYEGLKQFYIEAEALLLNGFKIADKKAAGGR